MERISLQRTFIDEIHRALGARMVAFAGWELPLEYRGIIEEHKAVRERAGIFDVSHMGEFTIEGPKAEEAVDLLLTGDASKLPVGRAMYTLACNERGTILDDLIVYRRAKERFLVVVNAANRQKLKAHFEAVLSRWIAQKELVFADRSDDTALFAVQGPRAAAVLAHARTEKAILDLPPFGCHDGIIASCRAFVGRTGYTGEDGFELFVHAEDAARLWNELLAGGEPEGLVPCGLGARDTLRLECAYPLYGNEIDESTHPFEAGLGWTVKLEKERDFIGKEALLRLSTQPLERKLVAFKMVGRGIARHGHAIYPWSGESEVKGQAIGRVTSGAPSPSLGGAIGLGYVPPDSASLGARIGIEIRGRLIEAEIVQKPFYRRKRKNNEA
ncbi:MAG: glycine cleavage system aminomethyltransferase GcvT [Sandaracinaceae bacterium]|nr:glycine cleavage system aminomethyltransferase GcvT [Sandaracinaceae bacterium]